MNLITIKVKKIKDKYISEAYDEEGKLIAIHIDDNSCYACINMFSAENRELYNIRYPKGYEVSWKIP